MLQGRQKNCAVTAERQCTRDKKGKEARPDAQRMTEKRSEVYAGG